MGGDVRERELVGRMYSWKNVHFANLESLAYQPYLILRYCIVLPFHGEK